MIYKFLLLSDEVDDFSRVIEIDSDHTFLQFQQAILKSVAFNDKEMTSFFICTEGWEKGTEVTLMPMDTNSDEDSWVMSETRLSELIDEEGQRLLFVFDIMTERSFFIELREIESGDLEEARISKSKGNAPVQLMNFEEFDSKLSLDLNENFYGDEEYDMDEIDLDGFDIGEDGSAIKIDNDLY